MKEVIEIVICTDSAALSYFVEEEEDRFILKIANALEEGTVVLDTVEGSKLILNAINVVAIELRKPTAVDVAANNIPPIQKS